MSYPRQLLSILARGLTCLTLEKHTHILRVFEARKLRNMFQGKICLYQELLNTSNLNSADFFFRRAVQALSKAFSKAARDNFTFRSTSLTWQPWSACSRM
jgi:hypothetical protein